MNYANNVKLIVYVPVEYADQLRSAIHEAGAGNVGDYSGVSFSSTGKSRFTPGTTSDPTIGDPGDHVTVDEERIEFLCPMQNLQTVIAAMKKVHPYEVPVYDVFDRIDI